MSEKNRLTKITTKKGDKGFSSLADGNKLLKSNIRFDAIGSIDELNAAIGMLIATLKNNVAQEVILQQCRNIQNCLFDIGGELSLPGSNFLSSEKLESLEMQLEQINQTLPPLKEFVLPGENHSSATAHFTRCVARRAERKLVLLHQQDVPISNQTLAYINRLSDYFFVISRHLARAENVDELIWQREIPQGD